MVGSLRSRGDAPALECLAFAFSQKADQPARFTNVHSILIKSTLSGGCKDIIRITGCLAACNNFGIKAISLALLTVVKQLFSHTLTVCQMCIDRVVFSAKQMFPHFIASTLANCFSFIGLVA